MIVNFVFYAIYVVEMIIKIGAMGFKVYFRDTFNVFDSFIVLTSTAEIVLNRIDSIDFD